MNIAPEVIMAYFGISIPYANRIHFNICTNNS
jgi:hypothetical protein